MSDAEILRRIAVDAAHAGASVVRGAGTDRAAIALKTSPTDVVTQTDVEAERAVRATLVAVTPEAGVVGEEEVATAPQARLQWVVDPLDGTVNFLYGVPLHAVSVAAAVDGVVVAGAVVDTLRGEVFSAARDGGARLDDLAVRTSGCTELSKAMITTGFSYQADERGHQGKILAEVVAAARDVRCFGSAALELCWVACGRVDAYYQRDTALWDRAAGALIASEAGALVELPSPENGDLTIAAARGVYEALRSVVAA